MWQNHSISLNGGAYINYSGPLQQSRLARDSQRLFITSTYITGLLCALVSGSGGFNALLIALRIERIIVIP